VSAEDLANIRAWIAMGAPIDAPAP
jgi:hypothetical protein